MNTKPILVALLLASCSSNPPPPSTTYTAPAPAVPVSYNGTYANPVVTAKAPPNCPLVVPPTLVISNGVVTLVGTNTSMSGTASGGTVTMTGPQGRSYQRHIDANGAVRGRFSGPNCVYDVYWPRTQ